MKTNIALITILANNVTALARFYQEALGFSVKQDSGEYVELESPNVRFSICTRAVMFGATDHVSYQEPRAGQAFELAFPVESPADVDHAYAEIIAKGAVPIKPPADMPWNQRTAFFADPEGNIHELFADYPPQEAGG
jgi:uncharacterized glyoxalase superfamily protein PhnB